MRCEQDMLGDEHRENLGLSRDGWPSNTFRGQIPSLSALTLPSMRAQQAVKKPKPNSTLPAIIINTKINKKKINRERISWKKNFSLTEVANEQNKYSRPFPATLLSSEATQVFPSQQSHFAPDTSSTLTLVPGNVKLNQGKQSP